MIPFWELFFSLSGLYLTVFVLMLVFIVIYISQKAYNLRESYRHLQRYENYCRRKVNIEWQTERTDKSFTKFYNEIRIKVENIRYAERLDIDMEKDWYLRLPFVRTDIRRKKIHSKDNEIKEHLNHITDCHHSVQKGVQELEDIHSVDPQNTQNAE